MLFDTREYADVGFPGGTRGNHLPTNSEDIRDVDLIPGLGRSTGGGHGNTLHYSCMEKPLDREACWATAHRIANSRTGLKQLSTHSKQI